MKCPHCNYVSFDSMPRCKKCGYQLKPEHPQQGKVDIAAIIPDQPVKKGAKEAGEADSGLRKTVSSIRETLAEIDGKSSPNGDAEQEEQPLEFDTDDLRFQVDDTYMNTSRQFPDNGDINWEDSVSLSNNQVTLPLHEDDQGSGKGDRAESATDRPSPEKERFQGALRQIGDDLKDIEDGPHVPENVPKGRVEEPIRFQHPAETAISPDDDANVDRVGKAGFWIRTVAYLIDTVILEFLSVILIVVGMLAMSLTPSGLAALDEDRIIGLLGPYYLFATVITILYFTYFHGSIGQTPGKMMCGLKVVRVNGEPLGYGKAFLRWVGYLPSSLLFGLGFLWIAWDRNKQGWHDKIAGTRVIRL